MRSALDSSSGIESNAAVILESITDAFYALDHDWAFTYVNRQAEVLLGRPRGDLLGKNIWQEYRPLIGSEFESLYHKVAGERLAGSITAWYPDHQRYYEVHAYPSALGISVYFRNVTENLLSQQRLRESESRFRQMADAIPQIVWIVGPGGKAEFFNRQWYTYTGAEPMETTPAEVAAGFVHPEDQAPTMEAWEAAGRAGRVFSVEHRIRSASGEYRWFLVRAEPERDPRSGAIVRWFGTSTDVHDRKLAEAALRRSEARYRSLFASIDEGFCILEMIFDEQGRPCDYRFLETNPVFERQTGLHDAVGRRARELVPGLEQHWIDMYGRVALTGEPNRFESESEAMGRWFDVYAFRVDEPEDRHVALLFTDVTQRRRAQQNLQTDARRKDEFLAMLAHELRNPLAPISAAADLLATGSIGPDRLPGITAVIARQANHMTGLLEDLLDVSRVTRGLVTLEKKPVDLKTAVTEAVEQVRPLIEEKSHQLELRLPPQPAFVPGDRKRLVQVLANLLGNAARYTPAGSGRITLAMEVRDSSIVMTVRDNGIGMTPDLIGRAFELFAQGERSVDRSQGGLGIGLALVRTLVHLHDGSIAIESDGPGLGTCLTVTLPLLARQADDQPFAKAEAGTGGGSLRILVIDDNADAAQLLAMFLQQCGHRVYIGHHARDALALAPEVLPEVFLLDIGLPDIDGNELVRRLRAMPELAHSVFVALTGYGQPQDREASLAAGFHRHLVKPVDSVALAAWLAGLPTAARVV
ncbi:hybrid sensor histidine kinase/response regulator [Noviherbaspirillum aridicola]|uniref:histidine kinase n=1 Tax=Noviherbaspirillum aridicola TaxID=2849687 RepID=A0ABQ4Q0S7_9BURK|nr:PAS domain S-box protein [Noviherbaspirillum aridicola]GIZ50395.1 hypothetical protein NCCP691_04090 [Noviherbaspirillum aridicola]